MSGLGPDWFHNHGDKLMVKSSDVGSINIASNAARLRIQHSRDDQPTHHPGYIVDWDIQHSPISQVNGVVEMTPEELAIAFCPELFMEVSDEDIIRWNKEHYGSWLIDRYGGEFAAQRQFIRYDYFLNIPTPGTMHDGDPNISIALFDYEIERAVRELRLVAEMIEGKIQAGCHHCYTRDVIVFKSLYPKE